MTTFAMAMTTYQADIDTSPGYPGRKLHNLSA
jgi:hypothetical protein